ncbi:maltooligosyl trehalose synthase [Kaistia soli DSM 19436]|uniref:Maltooligosyl trehalose synthase n=1 Tax=Kaistia soli DSM 19436 TaxID=1122133 RepID=A0A1M5IND2_9HYPH|nr:malto-oligosyltrehalose synthase [Kaistia soli]SHG29874.1 maltooligosyl trehalose synthase [Kaistia soli DSM 19436]
MTSRMEGARPVDGAANAGPDFASPLGLVRATYRVQFNAEFTFEDAERLSPYFSALGISHLYASPIFRARAGSAHGYDMVDPTEISDELGGEAGFRSMAATLAANGIGIILDIVPNHMAADGANPYWIDVLEFGADAVSAPIFDIDFSRRIALPWLGDDAAAIEKLAYDEAAGRVTAIVAGNAVPLRPRSIAALLDRVGAMEAALAWRVVDRGKADPEAIDTARVALRAAAAAMSDSFERALDKADLNAVHAEQHWQAVPWRQTESLNYRRFFEVSHLLGVCIEDETVFEIVHCLPLALLREGLVQGLRVDHVDGLADPAAYCVQLREATGPEALILIEKILGHDEALRPWPIDGTTGYERLNLINEAFVSANGRTAFQSYLEARGWLSGSPLARIAAAKTEVVEKSFKPELARLLESAAAMLGDDAPVASVLEAAVVALLSAFPVYRSYLVGLPASPEDDALWREAEARAKRDAPGVAPVLVRLVEAALRAPGLDAARFRRLFQQLSGPAMAKGFEDTELYRSVALASVNEVGSDLVAPPRSDDELHAAFAAFGPRGLTPLATHDTKRGADTRARLNLLSHFPERWIRLVEGWEAQHADLKAEAGPDDLDLWFIYQTLFAAWPLPVDRARGYFEKAMREAKRHSGWTDPDETYEAALHDFVALLIAGSEGAPFRAELEAFLAETAPIAATNSLSQTLLQLTLPGIPDIYRGTELADFSLVDPDNRRPVSWERREALLSSPVSAVPPMAEDEERAAKLSATRSLLALRARNPDIFASPYQAERVSDGWFAFSRRGSAAELVVAVPLTPEAMASESVVFNDHQLNGSWRNPMGGDSETAVQGGRVLIDTTVPVLVLTRAIEGGATEPRP